MFNYKPPITLFVEEMARDVAKQLDDETFKAIFKVVPFVDKDELIQALQYDRGQYEKGFTDGRRTAMEELVHCIECEFYDYGECVCPYKAMNDGAHYYPDPEDFCSDGHRKKDDDG